jgi:predicted permease
MRLWADLIFAARLARKYPLSTAAIIATLALCIGVNTAIFSVVDRVLLRALPYPQPERLVQIVTYGRGEGVEFRNDSQDGATWFALRDHVHALDLAVYTDWTTGVNLASDSGVEYVTLERVGAGYFRVLGVPPLAGREFDPAEDIAGGPMAVILSRKLWRRTFHSDPSIVGRRVLLRGEPHTVVGIMPDSLAGTADLWAPLRPSTTGEGGGTNYGIVGRLRPGATWAQAEAELRAAGVEPLKRRNTKRANVWEGMANLQEVATENLRRPLFIVWSAVGLVLLIGCVNVAGMLIARGKQRRSEIATRLALGASAATIVRQVLIESVAIAAAGGIAASLVGYAALRGLKALARDQFGFLQGVTLDARVWVGAAVITLFTSILFGVLPAIQATRVDIREAQGAARTVAGARRFWSFRLLVAGQVALAVTLLIGAGLLLRTFTYLWNMNPGFDGSRVVTASFSLRDARYKTSAAVNDLFRRGIARLHELPGVEQAAVALTLPYERPLNMGVAPPGNDRTRITAMVYVTPEFLDALRIPLLRGRKIDERDSENAPKVAVVNEAFARQYLGDDPLGKQVKNGNAPTEIVGVVGNVQQRPSWGPPLPVTAQPTIYIPAAQFSGFELVHTWFSPKWVVRAHEGAAISRATIDRVAHTLDPLLPIADFRTFDDVKLQTFGFQRFLSALLGATAGLALMLAALGIYALIANSVAERTRELGIRLALGAGAGRTIRSAAMPGIILAVAGALCGVILARASEQMVRRFIFGISSTDLVTFAAVSVGIIFIAAVASLAPALRISRIDPAQALRQE